MKKFRIALALLCLLPVAAQTPQPGQPAGPPNLYGVYQEGTLATAAFVVTIQQPATKARTITLESATIYCSVACNPALEVNGTAATATAGSPFAVNMIASPATPLALPFTASNVGSGTVVFRYPITAGAVITIPKSGLSLARTAGQNFTFRSDSISGNYRISVMWSEQ